MIKDEKFQIKGLLIINREEGILKWLVAVPCGGRSGLKNPFQRCEGDKKYE